MIVIFGSFKQITEIVNLYENFTYVTDTLNGFEASKCPNKENSTCYL